MIKFDFLQDPCDYLPWQGHTRIFDYAAKSHTYLSKTNPRAADNLFYRRTSLLINRVTWPKQHSAKSFLTPFFTNSTFGCIFQTARVCLFFTLSINIDTVIIKKDFRSILFRKPITLYNQLVK